MQLSKIFLSKTIRLRAFIFGIYKHHLEVLYKSCSNYAPGVKIGQPGSHNFILNYIRKSSNNFFSWTANGNLTNPTGMVSGWSPTKIVQMVLIGCISRSWGKNIGLQIAIFKNLVWNYKAQSFHIYRSSTNIWWTTLVVLCKWLHCDPWIFPQVSDQGPSCFFFLLYFTV